jgi:MFS family permease
MHSPSRRLPREVWALAAVAVSVAVGFGIVAPVIPTFARKFGVGHTAAGAVVSAFAFMRLVFGPAGGWLVNRFGERLVLATGLGIVAVSSLLTGFAQTYVQMLLLRGVGGVGSVMFTIGSTSLLLRSVEPHQRGRANSIYYGGFLIGGVSGPFVGGVLGDISLRLPFFVYAATLTVAGGIALAFLSRPSPEVAVAETGPEEPPMTVRTALRLPAYRAALTVNLGTGWAIYGVRSSLVPLFVAEVLLKGPLWTGAGLFTGSACQVLALWPAGRIADRVGRRPLMIVGPTLGITGAVLLTLFESVPAFLVAMACFGAAAAAMGIAPSAVVGDVVGSVGGRGDSGRGGTVIAAYGMASDVGTVIGPLLSGALAETSFAAAFATTGGVLAVGLAMALRMPETVAARVPAPVPPTA